MTTPDAVLTIARSQFGYAEGANNHTKFGEWYAGQVGDRAYAHAPWCDEFISWCAQQAGAGAIIGRFAYTPSHAQWFVNRHQWGQRPRKGAIVFYDWNGSHSVPAIDHVGIVESVQADGSVVTIEGNTGSPGAVRRRVRRTGIAGYGYPAYSTTPRPPFKPSKAPTWGGKLITQPPVMRSAAVKAWQEQMRRRGWGLAADGEYGPISESVCRRFQRSHPPLEEDGVIGPRSWRSAWESPTT